MNIARTKLKLELAERALKAPQFISSHQVRAFKSFVKKTKAQMKRLSGAKEAAPLFNVKVI